MESKNNKETINLLDLLSESDSELSDLILSTPKKKKVKRRHRSGVRIKHNKISCDYTKSKVQIVILWLTAISITFWLIALSWLAGVLYNEIRRMDISMESVLIEMDSVAVTVPLRPPTKKMKKRKELDALAPSHVITRRTSGKRSSQELLTESSDERSEYWNVSLRGNRKTRGRKSRVCAGLLKACSAFYCCASILAAATFIWLFIDVRQQLTSLRAEVDQAIAGSKDVPDALQKCHSLSKDLQKNQSILFTQLTDVKAEITNFTIQLSSIQQGLRQMQELLHRTPELSSIPRELDDARKSVATFGSAIQDLRASVHSLKATDIELQNVQNITRQNTTNLKDSIMELLKMNKQPLLLTNETKMKIDELTNSISQLKTNLSIVNETLSENYQGLRQDQEKDHRTIMSLQDATQNATSKVYSLEASCANASRQSVISSSVNQLTDDVKNAQKHINQWEDRIQQLEQDFNNLKNSTDTAVNTKNHEESANLQANKQLPQLNNTKSNQKIATNDGLSG